MKMSDIPAILDSLNEEQVALFNKVTDQSIKRYLHPETYEETNLSEQKLDEKDITYGEVFASLTKEQRYALYFTIETAINDLKND